MIVGKDGGTELAVTEASKRMELTPERMRAGRCR